MQQAVSLRDRLRWRCRAAKRAHLISEGQCAELEDRLLPSGDIAGEGVIDEVRDILDGLGVPAALDDPAPTVSGGWTCTVCRDVQRTRGWRCPFRHRSCRSCMVQWSAERPRPPCPAEGCAYRLGEHDLEDLRCPASRLEAFRCLDLEEGLVALQGDPESQVSVLKCPSPGCGAAVAVGLRDRRQRWSCSCGAPPMCTSCGASPYHHHGSCGDVQSLRARWLAWLQGGREAYKGLQRRAAREATSQQKALREALDQRSQLERDEQWKVENCRLCPKCQRPVEKMDGCNTMICGQNTHGGNRQPGCGQRFSWLKAQPYKARTGPPKRSLTAAQVLSRAGAISGRGVRHLFAQCALCGSGGKSIIGPRFRCIHCPSFNCCLKCEERLATEHEEGHVFEIMFEDELDWARAGIELPKGTRARVRRKASGLRADPDEAAAASNAAAVVDGVAASGAAAASRGRKRRREGEGQNAVQLEGVIKGQKRGKYVLELLGGGGNRLVPVEDLQPLLTQKQAERLLADGPPNLFRLLGGGNGAAGSSAAAASAAASDR